MKKEMEEFISNELGVEPIEINSALVSFTAITNSSGETSMPRSKTWNGARYLSQINGR